MTVPQIKVKVQRRPQVKLKVLPKFPVRTIPSTFFANPSGSIGLTAVNGSAGTAMRSDAAPALSQSIAPTWTGLHTFAGSGGEGSAATDGATLLRAFSGSSGSPVTTGEPSVGISRNEAVANIDGQGGQYPALYVESVGNNSMTLPTIAQTIGVTGAATQNGVGDAVGVYGLGTANGGSGRFAYGGFFAANAAVASTSAYASEIATANNTGSNSTYSSGGTPQSVGVNVFTHGANRATAGVVIGNPIVTATFDVGVALRPSSITTTGFRDDSGSVTVFAATGAHTAGIDLASGTFSGNAFASPGFSVDGTGNVTIASNKTLTIGAGAASKINLSNGTTIYRDTSDGSLTFTSQNGVIVGVAYNGTTSSANAVAVGRQGTTNPAFQIDASAASSATGLKVTAAAAAGGVSVAAISSGTNENLTVDAKGSGTITLGNTSTGAITLTRATTMSAALTYGGVTLSNAVTGTGNMVLSASPTITGTITANTFTGVAGTNLTFTAGAADNVVFAVSGAGTMILGSNTLYSNPGGVNLGLAGGFEFGALRLSKFVSTPAPATKTGNYSLAETDSTLIFNGSGSITLTLQAASSYTGRWLHVKNIAAFTVISASSNVVPLAGGAAGTAILPASAGSWALLQSDGTNWVIVAS